MALHHYCSLEILSIKKFKLSSRDNYLFFFLCFSGSLQSFPTSYKNSVLLRTFDTTKCSECLCVSWAETVRVWAPAELRCCRNRHRILRKTIQLNPRKWSQLYDNVMKNIGVRGVKHQAESEERSTALPRRDDDASRRKTNRLSCPVM